MPTEPQVRATSETMVFAVASDSRKGQAYRVDLISNGGASECSCRDWATRRWPAIKAGEPLGTRATMCKHVGRARRVFLQDLLETMAKSESQ